MYALSYGSIFFNSGIYQILYDIFNRCYKINQVQIQINLKN